MPDTTPVAQPFDPELLPTLEAFKESMPEFTAENLGTIRDAQAQGIPGQEPVDLTAGGRVQVDELSVPASEERPEIALLVLRPTQGEGPWPVIYNTHGGGMIVGTRHMEAPMYLPYVAEGLAAFVAVEYRLAPEHPDPTPVEDCYAGLVWTAENATDLGLDPDRILISGASAGGGLAAGTALLARDRGFPALTHQILVCPMIDDRFQTASSRMLDNVGVWDRNDNIFGWTSLLGERRGGPDVSIYAAPARLQDGAGLPPTYIDVGGAESFRDEAILYAKNLSEAGVSVDLHVWAGGFHGFDMMAGHSALARASQWVRDNFIRRALDI